MAEEAKLKTFGNRFRAFALGTLQVVLALLGLLLATLLTVPLEEAVPHSAFALIVVGALLSWWLWRKGPGLARRAIAGMVVVFCLGFGGIGILFFDGTHAEKMRVEKIERDRIAAIEKVERDRVAAIDKEKRDKAEAIEKERIAKAKAEALAEQAAKEAEKKKREAAELAELRKTNPDEYLNRIKETDTYLWTQEAKVLRPKLYAAYVEEQKRKAAAEEYAQQRKSPKDHLTLDFTWQKGGFDHVMIANFTIKSALQFAVHDVSIVCTTSGNSGTQLSMLAKTLYEVVPAKSTKRIPNVNMGLMNSQSSNANCKIAAVVAD